MASFISINYNIFWFTPFPSISTDTNNSAKTAFTSSGFDTPQQELIFFECHFDDLSLIFIHEVALPSY